MRKKLSIPFLIFFGLSLTLLPDNLQGQEAEEESIYVKALRQYIRWIERFEPETDTLYFEELNGITTLFPDNVGERTIQVLTYRNQVNTYQAHNGELIQRKMTPAQVKGSEIEIGIIPYQGRLVPDRGVVLSLSKWHAVIFSYNRKTERFEYNRFENR